MNLSPVEEANEQGGGWEGGGKAGTLEGCARALSMAAMGSWRTGSVGTLRRRTERVKRSKATEQWAREETGGSKSPEEQSGTSTSGRRAGRGGFKLGGE